MSTLTAITITVGILITIVVSYVYAKREGSIPITFSLLICGFSLTCIVSILVEGLI